MEVVMNHKYNVGDQVIIVGHPKGRLSPGDSVWDTGTNANYVASMDRHIGKETEIVRLEKKPKFMAYRLKDIPNCYWIDEWLEPANIPDVEEIMSELDVLL